MGADGAMLVCVGKKVCAPKHRMVLHAEATHLGEATQAKIPREGTQEVHEGTHEGTHLGRRYARYAERKIPREGVQNHAKVYGRRERVQVLNPRCA